MGRFTNKMEVNFTADYIVDGGVKLPQIETAVLSTSGVKRYPNTAFKYINLTTTEIILLEYLSEVMDSNNMVTNNHQKRLEFLEYMKKNCGVDYSDGVVVAGFKKLKKHGFLISLEYRGYYRVNPRHFYKGLEKDRCKLLKDTYTQVSTNCRDKNDIVKVIGYNSEVARGLKQKEIEKKRAIHRAEIQRIKTLIIEECKNGFKKPVRKKSSSKK
jgi:hypothetical protein